MEWAVASACLESCVLGKECAILLFKKEYAGLRVKCTMVKHTTQLLYNQKTNYINGYVGL